MNLFGFNIDRRKPTDNFGSFALPQDRETVTTVPAQAGGSLGFTLDLDGTIKTEAELIARYRDLAFHPEVDSAIDDIVNEAIVTDDPMDGVVKINLSDLPLQDNIKMVIEQEFNHMLRLLNFNNTAYELFRGWYIDGRKYFHIIIDEEHPENGIQKLIELDALKLRKIREISQVPSQDGGLLQNIINEYYIYNNNSFTNVASTSFFNTNASMNATKISPDSILGVTSGLMNENSTMVLSYLHPAIRPLNQLRMLEDSAVVYRLVRAPARRVFYIDVGGLPPAKAEQHMKRMMDLHKNKVNYDQSTGEVSDQRRFMTMIDDYWIPRREGQSTEIDTLAEGQNLSQMDDIEYFKQKLYLALKVPISRTDPGGAFNIGRPTEITRDELKFNKFVHRLLAQFSHLFFNALEKQLVLRQVIAPEEWEQIKQYIRFDFTEDNYFEQLKNAEILRDKAATTSQLFPLIGQFISRNYVFKNVWEMDDEQIAEMIQQIQDEFKIYGPMMPMQEEVSNEFGKLLNIIKEEKRDNE